jgi:septal ring factor EnvC (AmiA/AmiB activator)
MTGEEMERSIEFLLNSQASLEAKIEQTNDQVKQTSRQMEQTNRQMEQTNKRLDMYAETQNEFMQIVLRQIEAQGEINASLHKTSNDLTVVQQRTEERMDSLALAQRQTEERLKSLIETVDRYIRGRRDGKA